MIVGKKVMLRGFEVGDVGKLVQWRNDRDVNQYFFEYEPSTVERQERWLRAVSSSDDEKFFIISTLKGDPIGTIGLNEGATPLARRRWFPRSFPILGYAATTLLEHR